MPNPLILKPHFPEGEIIKGREHVCTAQYLSLLK